MADLAAANVTVTVQTGQPRIEGGERRSLVSIVFGNSILTYPTGGVPLPTYASWGFVRNIEYVDLIDPNDATGIVWKYDQDNHKLRGYVSGALTPAGTITAPTFTGTALSAHTHDLYVTTPVTADAAGTILNAASTPDLYVSQASTGDAPFVVTGIAAASGSQGGLVAKTGGTPAGSVSAPAFTGSAVSATVLSELAGGTYAVPAQTLYAVAIGW